jgi:hypothetical protein
LNHEEAFAFCKLLYGHEELADEGLCISVMSLTPGKRGVPGYTFCETPEYAADTAMKIAAAGDNAYAGMALVDPKTMKGKRGTAADARAIVGLWADIDIADPLVQKPGKNPPVNLQEALEIAYGVGVRPSVIVHSGHGLHAHWLFDRPWIFQDDDDRRVASDVARNWELTLHQVAHQRGRSLDSVGDLARVLRIPGTINTKVEIAPTNVTLFMPPISVWRSARRRTRLELESCIRAPMEGQTGNVVQVERLHDVELRMPTPEERNRIEANVRMACGNDQTFKETWNRDRQDFASSQHSASEYDMSLANQCAGGGWSNQDIYWAMLIWRQRHNEDTEKLLTRGDYIDLTIAKARKSNVVAIAIKKIDDISNRVDRLLSTPVETLNTAKKTEHDAEKDHLKKEACHEITELLQLNITGFHREGMTTGSNYYLEIDGQKMNCGDIHALFAIRELRKNLFESTKFMINPAIEEKQWLKAIGLLVKFMTEEENPYLDITERWRGYLSSYLDGSSKIELEDTEARWSSTAHKKNTQHDAIYNAMLYKKPFVFLKGTVVYYFSLEHFHTHVGRTYNDRTTAKQMVAALYEMGANHTKRRTQTESQKRISRTVWYLTEAQLHT